MTDGLATLLGLMLAVTATQTLAQESVSGDSLVLTTPEAVGMSTAKLTVAENLFVEALTNNKVLGYQLLVARRGGVVLHSAGGMRDIERKVRTSMSLNAICDGCLDFSLTP